MEYEGKIYRPWPEAKSVLIQATIGCSNNSCTFCTMFDDKKFKVRKMDEIFQHIDEIRAAHPFVKSIFLIDGNVMVMKTKDLLQILEKVKTTFPEATKISMYSELNDLKRKSVEDLKAIKEAGLTMVYSGLESGDLVTLEKIKKKMLPEDAIEGMKKAKEAGIKVLLSFIFGLGGKERSLEHIEETTKLLNILKPEEIAPMALAIQPNSDLEKELENGEFIQATPLQILQEEKYLLENMGDFKTTYWGDHGNNIVTNKGIMPDAREIFLKKIENAVANNSIVNEEIHRTFAW